MRNYTESGTEFAWYCEAKYLCDEKLIPTAQTEQPEPLHECVVPCEERKCRQTGTCIFDLIS